MPTSRSGVVLIGAIVLYFFANQTQVGWLYVMCAVLAGTVLSAWWLSRSTLRTVSGTRSLSENADGDLYEGDEVQIAFTLKAGTASSAQVSLTERCPLAEPYSPMRAIKLYVPSLPAKGEVRFDYRVNVYKRGVYEFPALELESSAPFGFVRKRRVIEVASHALVYPEVKPLSRFDLLDRQFAPQVTRATAGIGYEVMGLRPYRPGDSPRHIHWATVARAGQLVSKEFADETQPGVTLALDLFRHPYAPSETKHTPFEWAVKVAASIGDYANRRGYPLSLAANDEALPAPAGAISWYSLLQYLARVQPVGELSLTEALARVPLQAFVIAVLAYPDAGIVELLRDLHFRKVRVLAVVMDGESFPNAGTSAANLAGELVAAGIETRVIRFGVDGDWVSQLQEDSHPISQEMALGKWSLP
jgi:uncharacterized protein (DUF58 family)